MRQLWIVLKRNHFVLLLLAAFLLTDWAFAAWDPMTNSRRFYKNDFTKTLYHHDWVKSGPVFFGNSAVTGAYIEDKSTHRLTEMGLSYGKITDLQEILKRGLYDIQDELVLGIDVHTMIDSLETDPTYPWFKRWYQPYLYAYRDYFRDSGEELARNTAGVAVKASVNAAAGWIGRAPVFAQVPSFNSYEPRWIDKELYFGRKDDAFLKKKWDDYDRRFGSLKLEDFRANLQALQWVAGYAKQRELSFRVIWMPWNPSYPHPPYVKPLKEEVNRILQENGVPVLDLMDRYEARFFHDLVHLNREDGAPRFTKEVDEWLRSFAKSSKS